MYSPGAFIRTHLCTKSHIESKSAFITFCMKHPSSGLTTHHVQRCLRRVMTPSVPWRVGCACREWEEGRVKVPSGPAPVSVPILHLDHSLHCSWSPSTQSHGHFLDHICQDWAIPNIPFFHLWNLLFHHHSLISETLPISWALSYQSAWLHNPLTQSSKMPNSLPPLSFY